MKMQSPLRRGIAVAGLLALSLGMLTSCASRYETVLDHVVYKGPTNSYYSQDDTVVRDRETGELWRVNRSYPDGCLWERIGRTGHCYTAGGSK